MKWKLELRSYGLHVFLVSHGLYLPIEAGHQSIRLADAVAADVHGARIMRVVRS